MISRQLIRTNTPQLLIMFLGAWINELFSDWIERYMNSTLSTTASCSKNKQKQWLTCSFSPEWNFGTAVSGLVVFDVSKPWLFIHSSASCESMSGELEEHMIYYIWPGPNSIQIGFIWAMNWNSLKLNVHSKLCNPWRDWARKKSSSSQIHDDIFSPCRLFYSEILLTCDMSVLKQIYCNNLRNEFESIRFL